MIVETNQGTVEIDKKDINFYIPYPDGCELRLYGGRVVYATNLYCRRVILGKTRFLQSIQELRK